MRRVRSVLVGLSLLLPVLGGAPAAIAAPVTAESGTQFPDTAGQGVQAHGGGVLKVGDYYYWFGEDRGEDNKFRYVSAYRSKDLKNWEPRGHVLTQEADPEIRSAVIERPKVLYNEKTEQFVMWMHKEADDSYAEARAAVAVSSTVDGPYEWKGSFRPKDASGTEHMSRDITVYEDKAAGKAYMISAANHNADLHIYELTDDYTQVKGLVANPWPGQHRESPAVFKRGEVYFMLTSGTSYWDPNQQKYATATSLAGPWSPMKDVGNHDGHHSQTAFVLPVEGTETTSFLYMGDRWAGVWSDPKRVNDSKYVWLPLEFPTATTMTLPWYPQVAIDTETGRMSGAGGDPLHTITGKRSGACATVAGSFSDNQVPVTQEECTGGLNSQWRFTDSSNGYVRILAQHSGKCLDVADRSTADGAEVKQYDCGWGDNQRWRFETLSEGYVRIVAQHSSKCLDVQGGSDAAGARIVQSQCDGSAGQAWKVASAADPTDPTDPPAPGTADQRLTTSVSAGVLTMSTTAEPVRLPPVDFGAGGTSAGRLNTVAVKDFRGGTSGWSLTGRVTDFTGPRGKIDAGRLTWTPTCTTKPDSPSSCTAGSPGAVGKDGATLAHAPDGDLTGGEFTADAAVSLGIPKYTPVGDYAGTLTLTLL
ncbi:RICIN domain-containing protein (plasmid) [Streptomyces goshikiensis]|uniref:RICIN domain-containing protein n=1 Tax=Streptomyces goshikiensis TaxID=1942 RepID=A0ABZ1RZV6_9ACTN|nr:Extracellular exo-alpha-L-arabinofuranosidase precursor [Streptomyces sp. ADI91-18]